MGRFFFFFFEKRAVSHRKDEKRKIVSGCYIIWQTESRCERRWKKKRKKKKARGSEKAGRVVPLRRQIKRDVFVFGGRKKTSK